MAEAIERSQPSLAVAGSQSATRRRPRLDPRSRALGLFGLRIAAVISVAAGVVTFGIEPLRGHFAGEFEDFASYLGAARAVVHHTDLYAPFIHQPPNVALTGFDYPPVVAFLLQPLAWVSASAAATLWLWLTVLCTAAATLIAAFTLLPRGWPRVEIGALITFLFAAATYNYWHGQMNPVVFLLLALALHSWLNGHQTRFGVFIGIAASIKLAPILLIVLIIRRRWWHAGVACAVTIAVGLAVGVATIGTSTLHEYITRVLPVLSAQDGWLYNQSISGAVSRLFGHEVLAPQAGSMAISLVTYGVLAVMLGLLVVAISPDTTNRHVSGVEFGAAVLLMLLASTITWYAHYVTVTISVFAVLGIMAVNRDWRTRALVVPTAGFVIALCILAPLLIGSVTPSTGLTALSHTPWWWLITQVASLPTFFATALFVALTLRLRQHPLPARSASEAPSRDLLDDHAGGPSVASRPKRRISA